MKYFITTLPKNIIGCFKKPLIIGHVVAIFLTYIIVVSGFDWWYFISTRNTTLNALFFPAIIIGGIFPLIIPLCLLALGKTFRNKRTEITAWALGQAVIIGSFISSTYKAFTGRVQPNLYDTILNSSRDFRFGFFRHGIFWGWPSSHTTIAFAMTFTLIALYPKNKLVKYLSLIYAFYIGFGVSLSIHWLSEFVAGAFIGAMIGLVVGKSFKKLID